MMVRRRRKPVRASPARRHENTYLYKVPERLTKLSTPYIAHAHVWLKSHDASAEAFHSAGSSGDLPDLHGFHNPSTLSLLLDTVVGWRQLELISARSCALTLWILGTDAHATYAGAEAAPVARCGL